ncbi:hypothetical protein, partial [Streptomyces sp. NPDC056160]|uniref:hypothetical protein n=1 Tax=Streptomyces sp. NPDC056160 TaxID=3345731 RepID=UPI0035D91AF9
KNTQTKAQILASILLNGTHTTSLPGGAPHLTKEQFDTALDIWLNGHPETGQQAHTRLPGQTETVTLPPRTAEAATSSNLVLQLTAAAVLEDPTPRTVNIGTHIANLISSGRGEVTERTGKLLESYGALRKRHNKWILEVANRSGASRKRQLSSAHGNEIYAPSSNKQALKFEKAVEIWFNGHPETGQRAHNYLPTEDDTVKIPVNDPGAPGEGAPENSLTTVHVGRQVRDMTIKGRVFITRRSADLLRHYGKLELDGNRWLFTKKNSRWRWIDRAAELRVYFRNPENADAETQKSVIDLLSRMTIKGLNRNNTQYRPLRAYLSERFDVIEKDDTFFIKLAPGEELSDVMARAFVADVRVVVGRLERYFNDPDGSDAALREEVVEEVRALVHDGRFDDGRSFPIKEYLLDHGWPVRVEVWEDGRYFFVDLAEGEDFLHLMARMESGTLHSETAGSAGPWGADFGSVGRMEVDPPSPVHAGGLSPLSAVHGGEGEGAMLVDGVGPRWSPAAFPPRDVPVFPGGPEAAGGAGVQREHAGLAGGAGRGAVPVPVRAGLAEVREVLGSGRPLAGEDGPPV